MRFLHTACNKHDWTCTVPWHVLQLCVKTLQMTMTTTHSAKVIEQTSGDPCPVARVLSKQATHAPRLILPRRPSAATSVRTKKSRKKRLISLIDQLAGAQFADTKDCPWGSPVARTFGTALGILLFWGVCRILEAIDHCDARTKHRRVLHETTRRS